MSYFPEKNKDTLWWRDGVIYQIYPRSFADSNGDGIGDLKGIIGRLDYLADLGVDGIWLSPVYPSPDCDFGYDISDYKAIDPKFGTMDDFRNLLNEAHKREIHVIMDLVLNHTSTEHPWFKEARKSKDSPFHDYYLWKDPAKNRKEPNNWLSIFSSKSAWEYVEECGQFFYHMFAKEQADLNWRNPLVYSEMMDVFRFWGDLGVDGFRLDVYNMYFKDDQFRSNPHKLNRTAFHRQKHIYDCDRPEMIGVVKDIRKIVDKYRDCYVVGETFLSTDEKIPLYCGEDKLKAAFDFSYTHCKWDATAFRKIITKWEAMPKDEVWPTYVFNNHDVIRTATRIGLGENDERLKVAAAMTILLRGTPFIYYGEEIGMRQTRLKREQIMDPVGVNNWPFDKGRDGCRAPMQWNNQMNGGFSSGTPWNAIHPDFHDRNVNAMIHDPKSLWTFYKNLIDLRKQNRILQIGDLQLIDQNNEYVLSFVRKLGSQIALVCLNFSQLPAKVNLKDLYPVKNWTKKFSNKTDKIAVIEKNTLNLAGEQVLIMIGR